MWKILSSYSWQRKTLWVAVGSSVSGLSGLYTVAMKAAGASRRVFQLLDRTSSMPKSGDMCPLGLVRNFLFPGTFSQSCLVVHANLDKSAMHGKGTSV